MLKELLKNTNIAEKNLNFFIVKNGCGPATPLRVAKIFWEYFSIFLDNKLHDTRNFDFKLKIYLYIYYYHALFIVR